jgi:hypothetical protein
MTLGEHGGELPISKEWLTFLIKEYSLNYCLLTLSGWLEGHGRKWIHLQQSFFLAHMLARSEDH